MQDDRELLTAFQKGDESAFEELLKRYETALVNFFYRTTGSRAEAEDLAQQVFLKVYRAADSYVPTARFSTWLYRIAANLRIDHVRRKQTDCLAYAGSPPCTDPEEDTYSKNYPTPGNLLKNSSNQLICNPLSAPLFSHYPNSNASP
jgi:DNA-directed RNA polymerase specialized sigma24 family protein